MPRTVKRCFTLVEVLTLAAIVVLLLALITVGYRRAVDVFHATQCVHNLKTFYDAFGMRMNHEATGEVGPFMATRWPGALVPYTEGRGDWLVCPVHTPTEEIDVDVALGIDEVGEAVADRVEVKVRCGAGTFYEQLEPGPWAVKYSNSQYEEARGLGLLCNDNSADNLRRDDKYTDRYRDDGSGVYWLCIEDHGGDDDYKDVMVRVTDNHDGTVELWFRCGYTSHTNTLVDADTGEEIMPLPPNTEGLTHVLFLGGAGGWSDSGVVRWRGASSYALNVEFRGLRGGTKILALDYATYLAASTDLWDEQDMDPNGDGVPMFARHFGRVNVLRTDGSVAAMEAEAIDPARPTVAREFWLP